MSTRESMIHELKCWPEPYRAVKSGSKPFEWRKDDRGYKVGDTLRLREWDPSEPDFWINTGQVNPPSKGFTGDELSRTVTYIIREGFGIPEGYCIMGLSELEAHPPAREVVEAGVIVHEALRLGLRVTTEIRRTSLPGPIHADVLGAIHTFERACDPILASQPKEVAPTVDQIMEVVKEWRREAGAFGSNDNRELDKLRARLKTLFP